MYLLWSIQSSIPGIAVLPTCSIPIIGVPDRIVSSLVFASWNSTAQFGLWYWGLSVINLISEKEAYFKSDWWYHDMKN